MKLRMSLEGTSLFFISCISFSFYGLNPTQAALTACSRDHPGYDKCREINADCLDSGNRNYKCQCSEGYWMFEGRCQKSDWCADGEIGDIICKSNGTVCKNLDWTTESYTKSPFKCECESKFVQSGICSVNEGYCSKQGAKSYKYENITLCHCEPHQFFDYSMSKCQNLDLCPFEKCKGKYEECQGSKCVCKTSYWRDGNVCRPRKYCDSSMCGSAMCEEGPEDDPKRVRCYCDNGNVLTRGTESPYCKLVRCESHALNPCDHLCIYSNNKKSSHCACLPGYTLKEDNITCEIQSSYKCSYNSCDSRSICIKIDGEETCMCKNNLVGQGVCLDRCAAHKLLPGTCPGGCKSTEEGFQCVCEGKYKLSSNQVTCEERRMCLEGEEGLRNCSERNRTCVDTPKTEEGFTCGECMHGLQEYDGNCVDLCQVQENKRFCEERDGICVSVSALTNEVECKCRPLFAWKKNVGCVFANHSYTGMLRIFNSYEENPQNDSTDTLWNGEGDLDWKKLDHDISKSMLSLFGQAISGINVLHCRHDQVDGNHEACCIVCTIEIQLHFEDYGILQRLNAETVCRGRSAINVPKMFCFIPPYLKLIQRDEDRKHVEVPFHQSNVCDPPYGFSVCPAPTDCSAHEDIGFSCRCKEGFVATTTRFLDIDKTGIIEVCQDINECETGNICPNGTRCRNTMGSFECPCEPGLFRRYISGERKLNPCIRPCDPVNCIHGKCENHENGFYCRCDPGHSGLYCEEVIPNDTENSALETGHATIIAVGIVEAVIFILFIVLAVIFCRHRKCHKPKRKADVIPRSGAQQDNNARNRTIDHVHMRSTVADPNGGFRTSPEEDPDEPIYADCAHVT